MRIFKYPLEITNTQKVFMPSKSELLTVQMQSGKLCLWAKVDDEDPAAHTLCIIEIFGTGNPVKDEDGSLRYIGTVQDGALVWHVFERLYDIFNPPC